MGNSLNSQEILELKGEENFRNRDHVKSCPLLGFAKERKSSAAGIDCKVGLWCNKNWLQAKTLPCWPVCLRSILDAQWVHISFQKGAQWVEAILSTLGRIFWLGCALIQSTAIYVLGFLYFSSWYYLPKVWFFNFWNKSWNCVLED